MTLPRSLDHPSPPPSPSPGQTRSSYLRKVDLARLGRTLAVVAVGGEQHDSEALSLGGFAGGSAVTPVEGVDDGVEQAIIADAVRDGAPLLVSPGNVPPSFTCFLCTKPTTRVSSGRAR